jgi:hypothetical protein
MVSCVTLSFNCAGLSVTLDKLKMPISTSALIRTVLSIGGGNYHPFII